MPTSPRDSHRGEYERLVLVLPPGQQLESDVVDDVELVWREQSERSGFIFVCPVADEAGVFSRSDYGLFGQGAEKKIPEILIHLRGQFTLENEKLILLDIGGNGNGVISVLEESPQSFDLAIMAPAFDVNYDAFERLLHHELPPIVVLYGGKQKNRFEDWLEKKMISPKRVKIERLGLEPLYRAGMGNDRLRSQYAEEICRLLAGGKLKNARH